MEVWVTEEGKILHNHYSKPMSNTEVVHPNSGLSSASKRLMIFNEGLRRLKSCHPDLPWKTKAGHLTNLAQSMKNQGYTESFRLTIIRRVVTAYNKLLLEHQNGNSLYKSNDI